ncbi:hypothetical protein, partial [Mesorhizobium sp. M7A.F.Ca.AU.001.01.1.1]|uniref:hypothetical protein n=1 Tax=Mesorhizobium sp. M7A.F.Ca.AU.001.01.1.1 TaxID=2496675 RepID=UPI0019D43F2B
ASFAARPFFAVAPLRFAAAVFCCAIFVQLLSDFCRRSPAPPRIRLFEVSGVGSPQPKPQINHDRGKGRIALL